MLLKPHVPQKAPSPAVGNAFRILDYLARKQEGAGVSEIARALRLNKSTCYNVLSTMVGWGVVVKHPRYAVYRLGPKLIELGTAARRGSYYRNLVRRHVEKLVREAGLACLIGQPLANGEGIVVIDRVVPRGSDVLEAPIGQVYPILAPAMGRALLASMDEEEALELALQQGLSAAEVERLRAKLGEIRQQGFATSLGEYEKGVNAVATVVRWFEDEAGVVLCLIGRSQDLPDHELEGLGRRLANTGRDIELEARQRGVL